MSKYRLTDKYVYMELTSPTGFWVTVIPYDTETISIPSVPAWIAIVNDTGDKTLTITFTPTAAGSFGAYAFTAFNLYVVVTASFYLSQSNCCTGEPMNIAWLNRLGGWQNFSFNCSRTYEIDGASAKTFVNDLTIKYSDINDVYDAVAVDADLANRTEINLVATLKYAVQAFLYNTDTLEWDIPILIDRDSFPKYDRYGLKQMQFPFNFTFRFIYATKLLIQTQ